MLKHKCCHTKKSYFIKWNKEMIKEILKECKNDLEKIKILQSIKKNKLTKKEYLEEANLLLNQVYETSWIKK